MKTNDLKELVLSRPDLKITPFVSDDAASPDYPITMASIDKCYIDRIAPSPINDERVLIYGDDRDGFYDDYIQDLSQDLSEEECEEKARQAYEAADWEETIIIFVGSY